MDVRMIAHDMRTPLNALHLALQAALKMADAQPGQKEILALAERNSRVLGDMIEKLLALSEADPLKSVAPVLKKCRASEIVAGALDQIAPLAGTKSLKLKCDSLSDLPPLLGDKEKLIRVLVNLMNNAVRFSPMGGTINLRAKFRVNDGHEAIVFSVIDEGVGVPPEEMDRIFVEGVSTNRAGQHSTGLGLAVCKELVEAHGGRIWVEPNHVAGSTFSFSIPINIPRA